MTWLHAALLSFGLAVYLAGAWDTWFNTVRELHKQGRKPGWLQIGLAVGWPVALALIALALVAAEIVRGWRKT